MPHFAFNKSLWEYGQIIEDRVMPVANELFDCNFEKNENDIFDYLDFKDHDKKVIVEVKGRKVKSSQYDKTLVTASKITAGLQEIDQGYRVHFIFAFTDKLMKYELKEDDSFECRYTGTNCVQHYLIPISSCEEIKDSDFVHPENDPSDGMEEIN